LVKRIEAAIAQRNPQPLPGGEIAFTCPRAENHPKGDAHPSRRWNPEKATHFCDVCGDGGGATDLVRLLGIPLATVELPDLAAFSRARAFPVAVLREFNLRPGVAKGRPAFRYPTAVDVDRVKFTDGHKPKYIWAERGKGG